MADREQRGSVEVRGLRGFEDRTGPERVVIAADAYARALAAEGATARVADLRNVMKAEIRRLSGVDDVIAFLRDGKMEDPRTGGNRAITGWKSAADAIEREFGS